MSDVALRDYFAGKVIEGMVRDNPIPRDLPGTHHLRGSTLEEMARDAYALADAMLAERTKPPVKRG
ncbi:MAG TPA: hypothetical protein VJT73_07975 [Polyangiaceae bacterium]|nr:hypothetical protein [Polyangiaceae bacterium]